MRGFGSLRFVGVITGICSNVFMMIGFYLMTFEHKGLLLFDPNVFITSFELGMVILGIVGLLSVIWKHGAN